MENTDQGPIKNRQNPPKTQPKIKRVRKANLLPTPTNHHKNALRRAAALAVWKRWEQIGKLPLKEMIEPLHNLMFLVAPGPVSQEEAERDPNGTANDIFGPEGNAFCPLSDNLRFLLKPKQHSQSEEDSTAYFRATTIIGWLEALRPNSWRDLLSSLEGLGALLRLNVCMQWQSKLVDGICNSIRFIEDSPTFKEARALCAGKEAAHAA